TRFSRDWSSDVCSSDLLGEPVGSVQRLWHGKHRQRVVTTGVDGDPLVPPHDVTDAAAEGGECLTDLPYVPARFGDLLAESVAVGEQEGVVDRGRGARALIDPPQQFTEPVPGGIVTTFEWGPPLTGEESVMVVVGVEPEELAGLGAVELR